jgi:hypothetical protein
VNGEHHHCGPSIWFVCFSSSVHICFCLIQSRIRHKYVIELFTLDYDAQLFRDLSPSRFPSYPPLFPMGIDLPVTDGYLSDSLLTLELHEL